MTLTELVAQKDGDVQAEWMLLELPGQVTETTQGLEQPKMQKAAGNRQQIQKNLGYHTTYGTRVAIAM